MPHILGGSSAIAGPVVGEEGVTSVGVHLEFVGLAVLISPPPIWKCVLPTLLEHFGIVGSVSGVSGTVEPKSTLRSLAVTDKRLMFYDKAFLREKKALTSIPYGRISSVSSVDEGRGLFGTTSQLVVKSGSGEHEFEFPGGEKAQTAYHLIMKHLLPRC